MANVRVGNKIMIDSTGTVLTNPIRIVHILFTPDAANDQLVLREESGGSDCFFIRGVTAKQTEMYSFLDCPLIFSNGLHVQTLTSGAKAVIVTSGGG